MRSNRLGDAGCEASSLDLALNGGRMQMMAPPTPALLVGDQSRSRKQELPAKAEACSGILPVERTGQGRPSTAPLSVTAMQLPNELALTSERRTDSVRQYGHAILLTLSASDRDLCEIEVDVLDPQGQRFAHPHPRPIDHHPDEPILPRQLSEQTLDLSRGQHRGQGLGLSSPRNGVDILETQHLPKEERQGRSGLISALGRKVAFRQMIQEPLYVSHANRLDRDGAHKFQESLDPTTVSLFGLGGVSTRVE
jgi:hypothetical protein